MSDWRTIPCWDCGEAIPSARLAIQPRALRCISCQQAVELAQHQRLRAAVNRPLDLWKIQPSRAAESVRAHTH